MSDKFQIDGHKLSYHPQRVATLLDAQQSWQAARDLYPLYVEISPVGACNHRCTFCAVDYIGYQPVRFEEATLIQRIEEMGALGVKSIMFAGEGEPLLHKGISRIAAATKAAGVDVAFTSNATVLPKDFIDLALPQTAWFKASINAATAATYAQIHQTAAEDFSKAIDHLKRMVAARNAQRLDTVIGAQILLLPENRAEIEQLATICRDEIGLDYLVVKPYSQHRFSLTQTYAEQRYDDLAALDERLARFNSDRFSLIFRRHTMEKMAETTLPYSRCRATPMLWAYVMADGRVFSCSAYLLDDRFALGNLQQDSFQALWQGEKRQENWRFVRDKLDIQQCRRNCRMDEVNRYLHRLLEEPPLHVNFI
ncbi:MAG: radical SAM protein [Gammaproteobacteria bacterium]|nr:radical SAM protein [Gammaproteobacteria bacterium]